MEGSVANNWDESNVTCFFGCRESKYLEDICTMKGATVKKLFCSIFESRVWLAFSQKINFNSHSLDVFRPKVPHFYEYLTKKIPWIFGQTDSKGFNQNWAKSRPLLPVIKNILYFCEMTQLILLTQMFSQLVIESNIDKKQIKSGFEEAEIQHINSAARHICFLSPHLHFPPTPFFAQCAPPRLM